MKRGIWWALFLVCGTASAQDGVRWQYFAPPECPSEQQFRELVRARLLRDPQGNVSTPKESGESAVSVEVRLDPAQHRATLLLREPNTNPVERAVNGDSCDELASGLALITALAFGAAEEAPSATIEPQATAAEAAAATSARAPPPEPPSPTEPTSKREQAPRHAEPGTSRARPLSVELGAGGSLSGWSAPGVGLGADLFLRLAPQAQRGWSLRATALYRYSTSSTGGREAEFSFFGGRAEGCPISLSFQHRFTVEGCGALELGALRAAGRDSSALLESASDTVLSATALLTGRLRMRLAKQIYVEGQGDLGFPLVHHEFVFEEPRERIFRTPVVAFSGRIGLGVQFP